MGHGETAKYRGTRTIGVLCSRELDGGGSRFGLTVPSQALRLEHWPRHRTSLNSVLARALSDSLCWHWGLCEPLCSGGH